MKRKLTLAIMFIGISAFCFSQNINDFKNEIYASYGFFPVGHTTSPSINAQNDLAGGNTSYLLTNKKKSGTISIGYLHKISNRVSLGLSYTYSSVSGEVHLGSSITFADTEIKNHIVLINAKCSWVQKKKQL